MLESILIFLLFLGPLVFFHELGHFLMARLAGVRVETFSIGFGPKLFKFKRGATVYAFSLIPLGGYVKMFGDDPLKADELSEEERKVAYNYKSKWARFWIVFGGPLANFLMAFALYFVLLLGGEKVPELRVGIVQENTEIHKIGVRTGDVIQEINNQETLSFDDLNLIDSEITSLKVKRGNEFVSLNFKAMTKVEFITQLQSLSQALSLPYFVNDKGETFYLSSQKDQIEQGVPLSTLIQSGVEFFLHPVDLIEENKAIIRGGQVEYFRLDEGQSIESALQEKGFYLIDLMIESIVMGSAADESKLKRGDLLLSLDGEKLLSFEQVRSRIGALTKEEKLSISYLRAGKLMEGFVTPKMMEAGESKRFAIGIYSSAKVLGLKMVESKGRGLWGSIVGGVQRTIDGFVRTLDGFKMLITGDVSMKSLGGPIAIGKVATDSFNVSMSMFFRLMAIISINLGIINLFPIPVLDGGHIVFILLEALNGGPLSRRKMEIAQQVGLSFLFLLIFVALFNDLTRLFS